MSSWARCNFDGRPVSPGDQSVMAEFRQFLELRGRFAGDGPSLQWRQLRDDSGEDPYWEEWYCEVPPAGASYVVVLQDWAGPEDDARAVSCGPKYPVRRIFQVRMTDAAETRPARGPGDSSGPAGPGPGAAP